MCDENKVSVKDKIEYCKFMSQTQRTQFENRKKHEWKLFFSLIILFALTIINKATNNPIKIDMVKSNVSIIYKVITICSIFYFIFIHRANNINKIIAENSENIVPKLFNNDSIKIQLLPKKKKKNKNKYEKIKLKIINFFKSFLPGSGGYWDVFIKSIIIIVFSYLSYSSIIFKK